MKLRINVTKEHITKGKPCNGKKCPIKLALAEVFTSVFVGRAVIRLAINRFKPVEVRVPPRAKNFIDTFDTTLHRNRMRPFSFEIDVPDKLIDQVDLSNLFSGLKNIRIC